ncbi:tRNA glutamyl-Q(34) synthetase GluQRS [Terrihabitans sp. B22-R8]|uniref:tRNA glutamyl-Q(34) synthetase GluQRS n=1 Tax=Terrihabitans sp. B22-R8 TaxID=3425128 RepID=UPI00403D1E16
MTSPVFRFAPSPNGYLHLGHALSAILNAGMAHAAGGRLLLRIEDIDPTRSQARFETAIFEDLAWLGLEWEEPVRRQSAHLGDYAARLDELRARRLIYPCFCSRGEVRAAVAAKGGAWPKDPDGAPLYPGTCRHLPDTERARRLASGAPHVWRVEMAHACAGVSGALGWDEISDDGSMVRIAADPAIWGDAVLARRDVAASYHLCVVHDDAAQGVTHVVRGRDLYFATALHRLLQEIFGMPAPLYHHHRLLVGEDGHKLAKSHGSPALRDLRAEGVGPGDIRRMIGLSPPPTPTATPPR